MDLIASLTGKNNVRGITLNKQIIDLFNIIEQSQSHEDAIKIVNKYLQDILEANKASKEMGLENLSTEQKIKKVIEKKANSVPNKEEFLKFIFENANAIRLNWDSKEKLDDLFSSKNIDGTYIDEVLNIKKYFEHPSEEILTFLVDNNGQTINTENEGIKIDDEKTYQKVKAVYEYVTSKLENEDNRFNRLTLDGQGKFGAVAGLITNDMEKGAQPENYNLESLKQGYEFAKEHNMDVRINALVFFKDFPDRLVGANADAYKTALINYGRAIASVVNEYASKGVSTTIDMFNEFIDYYKPFSERTNNWMSKLSVEDLCEVALELKKVMPNVDFGYNDWNFENPQKRESIFNVIRKIQAFEKEHDCKIIDHIGTQCHTNINDIEEFKKSIEELQQFGLPIDITELDISKGLKNVDYKEATPKELAAIRKYEQKLQNEMMRVMSNLVGEGKIRGITSWSVTDELCCHFCVGKQASVAEMNYDNETGFKYLGKGMEDIELSDEENRLIDEHKNRVLSIKKEKMVDNPTQDFCIHTHTERCGHGAKDTGDKEFVEHAIKGGMKKIAFTDHMPVPDGIKYKAKSRMDMHELESYLDSINQLQEDYKGQIEIESGFEFEYSDRDIEHLEKLKSKTDIMILGQHFVIDGEGIEHEIERESGGKQISDDVLNLYKDSIIVAVDKGFPDVIAHPDLFMRARDEFGEAEEKVARDICKYASEKGIPLEINFGQIAKYMKDEKSIDELKEQISYPSPEFWKIVAEETRNGRDLVVIYGKDAHYPDQLSTEKDYEIAKAIIGEQTLEQLHIVTNYEELDRILSNREKAQEENHEQSVNLNTNEQDILTQVSPDTHVVEHDELRLGQLESEQMKLIGVLNDREKKYEQLKKQTRGKDAYEKSE